MNGRNGWRGAALALILAAANTTAASAPQKGECLSVVNVEPWDFLYIRSRPDHRSAKAGAIAPDTVSPIIVTGRCTPPGATPRRLWCPVDYYVTRDAIRSGYVKMFFAKTVPCPPSVEYYRGQNSR